MRDQIDHDSGAFDWNGSCGEHTRKIMNAERKGKQNRIKYLWETVVEIQ